MGAETSSFDLSYCLCFCEEIDLCVLFVVCVSDVDTVSWGRSRAPQTVLRCGVWYSGSTLKIVVRVGL